jgi:hypothetical protein
MGWWEINSVEANKKVSQCRVPSRRRPALLHDVIQHPSGESNHPFYRKAAENAEIPFENAVERLASDPYVLNDAKKSWTEKSEEQKWKAAENKIPIPFNNADAERTASDPNVSNVANKTWMLRWREKSKELRTAPLTFLEHLVCLFLRMCQSCRKEYELDNDDRNGNDVQTRIQDARSRRMEMNAFFFSLFLVSLFGLFIGQFIW